MNPNKPTWRALRALSFILKYADNKDLQRVGRDFERVLDNIETQERVAVPSNLKELL